MKSGYLLIMALAAIFCISLGCAGPTRVEMDYGTSAKLAKFNQILNTEAEKNLEPVTGFDGIAAGNAIERYEKTFQEKPQSPVYTINIGNLAR